MKSQRRLRLRGIGKHNGGNAFEWTIRHHVRNNLARAFERNCHPKHYDTGIQMPCYTMDYITGVTTWHGIGTYRPHAFVDMTLDMAEVGRLNNIQLTLTPSETQ